MEPPAVERVRAIAGGGAEEFFALDPHISNFSGESVLPAGMSGCEGRAESTEPNGIFFQTHFLKGNGCPSSGREKYISSRRESHRYNWRHNGMPIFAQQTAPIYGVVGFMQFTVSTEGDDGGFLYSFASERHEKLEEEVRSQAQKTLGSNFEVLNVRLDRGSVEIMIMLGAVGTFFMGFSRYESFIKSVNLLTSQLKRVFQRFFESASPGPPDISIAVTGSWQPSSTVLAANETLNSTSGWNYGHVLLAYLILSHAALLFVFLWLVIHHLK